MDDVVFARREPRWHLCVSAFSAAKRSVLRVLRAFAVNNNPDGFAKSAEIVVVSPRDMDKQQQFELEALPHLDAVYRFALRLTGSPADAEDLVQETFLRAYRSWDHYTPGTRAKSWLFTICRNAFLRLRQQDTRRAQVLQEAAPAETPLFMPAYQEDPEGMFFSGVVDETVLQHINEIPEEFREVVLLSDLEGLSYAEIAKLLEIPLGTVKSRLFRGRKLLQKALYDYARETGIVRAAARPLA
jgi:RNA polymerase sigma-70 factor (ECF subfamily)